MIDEGESMLELSGALANCLSRATARMSLDQLNGYEAEELQMLQSQEDETVAANAFRSVLREIDSRRAHLFAQ